LLSAFEVCFLEKTTYFIIYFINYFTFFARLLKKKADMNEIQVSLGDF